jgi:hypothetical protein
VNISVHILFQMRKIISLKLFIKNKIVVFSVQHKIRYVCEEKNILHISYCTKQYR